MTDVLLTNHHYVALVVVPLWVAPGWDTPRNHRQLALQLPEEDRWENWLHRPPLTPAALVCRLWDCCLNVDDWAQYLAVIVVWLFYCQVDRCFVQLMMTRCRLDRV